MRDRYLFRGMSNGYWYYGAYIKHLPYTPYCCGPRPREDEYKHLIILEGFSDWGLPRDLVSANVDPKSVGLCSGVKDRNNNLIFEGDIVTATNFDNQKVKGLVEVDEESGNFRVVYIPQVNEDDWDFIDRYYWEIIGNKFKNKELIEG